MDVMFWVLYAANAATLLVALWIVRVAWREWRPAALVALFTCTPLVYLLVDMTVRLK